MLKTIPDMVDTKSAHTGIAFAHLTNITSPAPHTCDYMGYVRRVGHAARSSKKNHRWLPGVEQAKFSLQEKWME